MKSFSKPWSCAEAIQWAYFLAPKETTKDGDKQKSIRQEILLLLGHSESRKPHSSEHSVLIENVIAAMRTRLPAMRHNTELLGLVWIRLALHVVRQPLSLEFLRRFFSWRAKSEIIKLQVLQRRNQSSKKVHGKELKLDADTSVVGYRIDEFLSKQSFNYCEYHEEWKLSTFTVRISKAKRRSPEQARTRQEVCGSNLLERLSASIQKEASRKRERVLQPDTAGDRYTASVSRPEMTEILKKRHASLREYSDTTLMRALPQFVQFPRGRPKRVS